MIGLKRGTVALYPHDPEWDVCAAETIALLKNIWGDIACDIRHVGSTSIPAICAKPIIDIAIGVRRLQDAEAMIEPMRVHGFHQKNVGHDKQVFFSAGDFENDIRTHHIHVVEYEGMEWRNYLNFKSYLNHHLGIARQYEALKQELAAKCATDREVYTARKAEFIKYTLRKAMVWSWLGQTVKIGIDRPIGFAHKKDIVYPINYGYIPGVMGGDDEELDVYLLGVDEPVETYTAQIIAIVHRENDVEDKLVAVPEGMHFTMTEIAEAVNFQEKYYDSHIELYCGDYTIREYRKVDIEELLSLYRSVGWRNYTDDPDMLQAACQNSLLMLAAYRHDRLIGLVRVVGDGHSVILVQDLLVDPAEQRRGIDTALMHEILLRYRDVYHLQLMTDHTDGMKVFYQKLGLVSVDSLGICGMMRHRTDTNKSKSYIREMKEEEIDSCVVLIRESFLTVAEEFGLTEDNAPRFTAFAANRARLEYQYHENRPMFVYVNEERPIGYYSLHQKDSETVELNQICIYPDFRHHKLGEKLLLHAIREAMVRGYLTMTIGIVEENTKLRAWYEKYGFVHVKTEKLDIFPFTCGYMTKKLFSGD